MKRKGGKPDQEIHRPNHQYPGLYEPGAGVGCNEGAGFRRYSGWHVGTEQTAFLEYHQYQQRHGHREQPHPPPNAAPFTWRCIQRHQQAVDRHAVAGSARHQAHGQPPVAVGRDSGDDIHHRHKNCGGCACQQGQQRADYQNVVGQWYEQQCHGAYSPGACNHPTAADFRRQPDGQQGAE